MVIFCQDISLINVKRRIQSRWLGIGHILCATVALLIDLAKLLLAGDHLHAADDADDADDGDDGDDSDVT